MIQPVNAALPALCRWLLLVTSILATPMAAGQSLWSQRNGSCLLALNFPAQSHYRRFQQGRLTTELVDVESADDFVVPAGRIWALEAARGSGSFDIVGESVWIRVYREQNNLPEADPICSHVGIAEPVNLPEVANGYFQVNLPPDECTLAEGRYWISISRREQLFFNNCPTPESCPIWAIRQFIGTPPAAADRDWAIRDVLDNIPGVACSDFGPGSSCRGEPTGSNLCFEVVGEDLENLPPMVAGKLPVSTLPVDTTASLDLAPLFSDDGLSPLTYSAPDLPTHFALDAGSGELTGTPPAAANGQDAVFEVFADDGLTTPGLPATVVLQYFDPDQLRLGEQFQGEVVLRCSGDPMTGATIESVLDFGQAGPCDPTGGAECPPVNPQRRISNALLAVKLRHPQVRELALSVTSPSGDSTLLVEAPLSGQEASGGGCFEADVNAVFSDIFLWPAEQRCDVGDGLIGYLEPEQSLARFRNGPAAGSQPWTLSVTNQGTDDIELAYWCVALQLNDSELPVFPMADLPGSAVISEQFDPIVDPLEFSGELRVESDVDWWLIDQNEFDTLQRNWRELSVTVTPAAGLALRVSRYFEGKRPGSLPQQLSLGNCTPGEAVSLPMRNGSSDFIRIQGCPGSSSGSYQMTLTPGGFRSLMPQGVGLFTGSVVDGATALPVPGVFLFSRSGEYTVSDGEGTFRGPGLAAEDQVLDAFRLGYEPGVSAVFEVIPDQETVVPAIVLAPQNQQSIVNDAIFLGGNFETPDN